MNLRQTKVELRMLERRAAAVELDHQSKQLANQLKEQSLRSKEADENRKKHSDNNFVVSCFNNAMCVCVCVCVCVFVCVSHKGKARACDEEGTA